MTERTPYDAPLRDRIAVKLCNAIMRVLATERYRKMVAASVRYGLLSAARDEQEGLPGPLPPLPESAYAPGAVPLEESR